MIIFPLLAILICYVAIAGLITYFIGRRFGAAKTRVFAMVVIALIFVAIPTADHVAGYAMFKRHCETEAGTKIYQTVENVEGFRTEYLSFGRDPDTYKKYGYRYVEQAWGIDADRGRYSIDSDSKIVREEKYLPHAQYVLKKSTDEIFYNLVRETKSIEDIRDGEPIAARVDFLFRGGWVLKELSKIGGGGDVCPNDNFSVMNFVKTVLKPINAKR